MLRKAKHNDIELIAQIWLETNIDAHDYIKPQYWHDNFEEVKSALANAEIFLVEEESIKGFIGLSDNYIAGLFVKKEYQKQGVGQLLLEECQIKYDNLCLHVYMKNHKATNFYQKNGFVVVAESVNENSQEVEYLMEWSREGK